MSTKRLESVWAKRVHVKQAKLVKKRLKWRRYFPTGIPVLFVMVWEFLDGPLQHNGSVFFRRTVNVPVMARDQHPNKLSTGCLINHSPKDSASLGHSTLIHSTDSFGQSSLLRDWHCCIQLTPFIYFLPVCALLAFQLGDNLLLIYGQLVVPITTASCTWLNRMCRRFGFGFSSHLFLER